PSTSKVGEVTINGQSGSIYNYKPANLPDPGDRTAPGAVALVVGAPLNYAKAAPILVVPRGNGNHGLHSTTDPAGFNVTSLRILQYGLVPQNLTDPLPALPYIFNPTECNTAAATGDTSFADGSTSHASFTMMPRPAEGVHAATDRAQLDSECARFPWNGVEPNGNGTQNTATLKVGAFATVDGDHSTPVDVFKLAPDGCNGPADNPCQNLVTQAHLDPIGGDIWAGRQVEGHPNQFRIYGEITDGGITRVKLQGVATADEQTGQITATFDNLPELPVYDVDQRFFGGDHATLTNPDTCGTFTVGSQIVPWAAVHDGGQVGAQPAAATPSDGFTTSYDGSGAACPADKPFLPGLALLSDPFPAGADTTLTTSITIPER